MSEKPTYEELKQKIAELQQETAMRKRAEEELERSNRQNKMILEAAGEGIYGVDLEGCITFVNPAAANMMGFEPEELLGRHQHALMHHTKLDGTPYPDPKCPVLLTMNDGYVHHVNDELFLRKDGTSFPVDYVATPVEEKGKIVGAVVVFKDATVRKKIQQEFQKSQKIESIGILAGGIAHDFNNLLTAILGHISLAKMLVNPKNSIYENLTECEKASLKAKDLTKKLLTFSKGGTPHKAITDIGKLIEEAANFALSGSNVSCEFSILKNLWPALVDEAQVNQVINNIIINAREAMPEGGTIFIRAENIPVGVKEEITLKERKYIKISIKDQGVGIAEENLHKIFDPYFSTKQMGSQKGMGFGLSICHSIIRNHAGLITVDSEPDDGSTFNLYLPASEIVTPMKTEDRQAISLTKGKILVMDDEELVRNVTYEMLTNIGYDCEFAVDGAQAVELYTTAEKSGKSFDAVLMDLTIRGGMGGKETIKKLIEITPNVKAIVSSGYSNDPVMIDYKEYGFRSVITKPYDIEELKSILEKVLGST